MAAKIRDLFIPWLAVTILWCSAQGPTTLRRIYSPMAPMPAVGLARARAAPLQLHRGRAASPPNMSTSAATCCTRPLGNARRPRRRHRDLLELDAAARARRVGLRPRSLQEGAGGPFEAVRRAPHEADRSLPTTAPTARSSSRSPTGSIPAKECAPSCSRACPIRTTTLYRERMKRFAGMYMGEDPEAPNYDPVNKVIKSIWNGSKGPMMRKATTYDWVGDPVPGTFHLLHNPAGRGKAARTCRRITRRCSPTATSIWTASATTPSISPRRFSG